MLIMFSVFALFNLIAITRTIQTDPGTIPEDREWDIESRSSHQVEINQDEEIVSETD